MFEGLGDGLVRGGAGQHVLPNHDQSLSVP